MNFTDTAGTFLNNALGNVEKAIIRVVDDGNLASETGDARDRATRKLQSAEAAKHVDYAFGNLPEDVKMGGLATLAQLAGEADDMFARGKMFTVQFNPNSIQFHATGGGYSEIKNYAKSEEDAEKEGRDIGISYGAVPFQVTMEVDLIFNKVDPNDAFVEVMQSMATMKGIAKTGANLFGKNASYSVQNEIEGLIAATRVLTTCLISFNWGKLCYSGVLQNLSTNYTVFNPKGEPVAGTAHLSMILYDENKNQKSVGKWLQAYTDAFKEPRSLASAEASFGGSAFTNFTF